MEYEKDGEPIEAPRVISKEYTLSMHPKSKLRGDVDTWLGMSMPDKEAYQFDFFDLVGKNAILQVVHKVSKVGNPYAMISAVMPLMPDTQPKMAENEFQSFSLGEAIQAGEGIPEYLPEWIREKIAGCHEIKNLATQEGTDLGGMVDAVQELAGGGEVVAEDDPFRS